MWGTVAVDIGLLTKPKYLTTVDVTITKVIKLHPRGMRVYTDILPMLVDMLQSDQHLAVTLEGTRLLNSMFCQSTV